ncbi:hypothetical protein [Paraburkholderia sp. J67]|uniref:hypothetical protein n=1 Tax=Paraburkholderia sp. J67 TaxID=2805435 RepID=UPI002ABDCC6E|nr:hypothetical protein [Paraburkholderia sp. J67]
MFSRIAAIAHSPLPRQAFLKRFNEAPDFVERIKTHAPMNGPHREGFLGGSEKFYTDYPTLGEPARAKGGSRRLVAMDICQV